MNIVQKFIQNAVNYAFPYQVQKDEYEADIQHRQKNLAVLSNYYDGKQKRPIFVNKHDYNVISNQLKVVVDRSVSMLIGGGVEFDLPGEGETEQEVLINSIWDANKKDVLLHDLCQFGSVYGTPFIKILPAGKMTMTGQVTDRLVALNPYNTTIYTMPDDIEQVRAYVYRWTVGDEAWREVTELQDNNTWMITTQKTDTSGKWSDVSQTVWEYDFSPIVHGKNLPNAGNVYGYSDIEGVVELQDRYNEAQSNINKILSLQAFAQKYIVGGKWPRRKDPSTGEEYLDMSPDIALEIPTSGTGDAKIGVLQPSGDLDSSRQFVNDIRRDIFEATACVDAETVKDKIGALTNFGLRVLFKNELAKNATKQLLYGDLLLNVNNRLLRIHNYQGAESDPGKVIYGDALPENGKEEAEILKLEMDMGVVSKQTASKELGYDWESEQTRLTEEKTSQTNAGAEVIKNFLAGR